MTSSSSHLNSPPRKMKKKSKTIKGSSKHTLPEVKKLGIELLSSRTHINNLPILLSIIENPSSPPHFVLESLLSLQAFFTPLLPSIPSHSSSKTLTHNDDSQKDAEFIYLTWLRSKFDQLAQSLIELLVSESCDVNLRVILATHFVVMYVCILFDSIYFFCL